MRAGSAVITRCSDVDPFGEVEDLPSLLFLLGSSSDSSSGSFLITIDVSNTLAAFLPVGLSFDGLLLDGVVWGGGGTAAGVMVAVTTDDLRKRFWFEDSNDWLKTGDDCLALFNEGIAAVSLVVFGLLLPLWPDSPTAPASASPLIFKFLAELRKDWNLRWGTWTFPT